jgi:hypothetical protein
MAEYLPVKTPGEALVHTASATIAGGQLLAISGSDTVAPAGVASTAWIGVSAFDAVANERVTVYTGGVQELTASGAIVAGGLVSAAANGAVAAAGATPAVGTVVGIAVTTAANGLVRVKLAR